MRRYNIILIALVLPACDTVPTEPVTYEARQVPPQVKVGFFTYSDGPNKHYLEYQGTDGNTLEQLEAFIQRRASAICDSATYEIEVNRSYWSDKRFAWVPFTPPGGNVAVPMPATPPGTFPKVWARLTCGQSAG